MLLQLCRILKTITSNQALILQLLYDQNAGGPVLQGVLQRRQEGLKDTCIDFEAGLDAEIAAIVKFTESR